MITILSSEFNTSHEVLARHQDDAIRIPITIYYSNITDYRFASGFKVDTGEPLVQRYTGYFWINKPLPPLHFHCGYKAGVRPGIIELKYSAGYRIKFSELLEVRYRSFFKRLFLFNERIRYSYKAGFKFKLGSDRLKLPYHAGFNVVNRKEDPLVLSFKCSYKYYRRGESEYRYLESFNVTLINRLELEYKTSYRHSVSKFVFPRKYNTNAAGVNTNVAELPIPWKLIKQKDGSRGIRIALDKEKLDLGSDGLRVYLNFPPKYINFCAVMKDKFEKLPDAPVVPPAPPAPPVVPVPKPVEPPPAPEPPPVITPVPGETPSPDTEPNPVDPPHNDTEPPAVTPGEDEPEIDISKIKPHVPDKSICKYNIGYQANLPSISEDSGTDPTIPESCYRLNHGIRFQCLNIWENER